MARIEFSYLAPNGSVIAREFAKNSVSIGSARSCDLIFRDLNREHCRVYLAAEGFYAYDLAGNLVINERHGSAYLKDQDVLYLANKYALRFHLLPDEVVVPAVEKPAPQPKAKHHSPGSALFLSIFLPGAGQAYNGQPVKALLFLIFSILILPWIWSWIHAYRTAGRIALSGGRRGRGGWLWVILHIWLIINVSLFTAIGFTVAGVIK